MKLAAALGLLLLPAWLSAGPVDPGAPPPSLAPILSALAVQEDTTVPFTETRYSPLKRRPIVVEGVARLARGRGLSLDYAGRTSPTVILDDKGLLLRHADGHDDTPPAEASAALRPLHALFALDLATLGRSYEIDLDQRTDGSWTLTFSRREGDRSPYRQLALRGQGERLTTIDLSRSENQRVEIALHDADAHPFTSDELARYFR